jgi:hypothetical protein
MTDRTMTTTMELVERAQQALAPIAEALVLDGYSLDISAATETSLSVRVTATEAACAECLVPKDLMTSMMRSTLDKGGLAGTLIELTYPLDGDPDRAH